MSRNKKGRGHKETAFSPLTPRAPRRKHGSAGLSIPEPAARGFSCPQASPSPPSSALPIPAAALASPPARPGLSSRTIPASVPARSGLTWTVSPHWAAVPPGAARRDSRSSSSSPWRENRRPLHPLRPPARDADGGAHGAAAAVSPAPARVRDRKRPCSPSLHRARGLLGAGTPGPAKLGAALAPWPPSPRPAWGEEADEQGGDFELRGKFPEGREHPSIRRQKEVKAWERWSVGSLWDERGRGKGKTRNLGRSRGRRTER